MAWIEKLVLNWKQFKNERLYRRVSAFGPVTITVAGTTESIQGQIGNWSPGGIFVLTPTVIPTETLVDLRFALDSSGGSSLHLRGQVVRHQSKSISNEFEGMGIMFTDFTQSGLMVLRDLLSKAFPGVSLQ